MMRARLFLLTLLLAGLSMGVVPKMKTATPIKHFIVVMQNNHSFDNYFGTYPGADGLPPETCIPVEPTNANSKDCVQPFHLGDRPIEDLDHSSMTFLNQYNQGRMDGFVYALDQLNQDGTLSMGHYDDRDLPYYWNLADQYVLFDRFFSSAHGGSVWNRMYAIAAVPGNFQNRIPPKGFEDITTIFDELQERGITWKFYVNNYVPNLNYRNLLEGELLAPQVQWMPLLSIDRFIDDPQLSSRIVDLKEYYHDLDSGTLPSVAYVLILGASEHPLSSLKAGQNAVRTMLQALMSSEYWSDSAFILTYDDWGGWYDHVPPPQIDRYGYGFRVPTLLVSPYAKQGFIDSTVLDFTSLLKFIEENWGIPPLASRDASANGIENAFDFSSPTREAQFIPSTRQVIEARPDPDRMVIMAAYGGSFVLAGFFLLLALYQQSNHARRLKSVSKQKVASSHNPVHKTNPGVRQ